MVGHCPRQPFYIAVLVLHLSRFALESCAFMYLFVKWACLVHHRRAVIRQQPKVIMNTSFHNLTKWSGEFIYLLTHTPRPPLISSKCYDIKQPHRRENPSLIKLFWGSLKFCWPFYGTLECKLQLSGLFSHSRPMKVMKLDSVLHGSALSSARLVSSLTAPRRGVTRILLISHKRRINRRDNHGHNVRPRHLLDDTHNITPIIRWFDSGRPGQRTPINTCARIKCTED